MLVGIGFMGKQLFSLGCLVITSLAEPAPNVARAAWPAWWGDWAGEQGTVPSTTRLALLCRSKGVQT